MIFQHKIYWKNYGGSNYAICSFSTQWLIFILSVLSLYWKIIFWFKNRRYDRTYFFVTNMLSVSGEFSLMYRWIQRNDTSQIDRLLCGVRRKVVVQCKVVVVQWQDKNGKEAREERDIVSSRTCIQQMQNTKEDVFKANDQIINVMERHPNGEAIYGE